MELAVTFARGATLTTATTFGHADTSNLGPTAGNGFYKRWPDDLALFQEIGLTDLRLSFDWARLQSKPGDLDGAWSERFEQILTAADAIGLRVWSTLYDGAEPRWVTNEGGMSDESVENKWWPRFAEKVADRFGDDVAGWIPFAVLNSDVSNIAWDNAWVSLSGGGRPVVCSVQHTDIERVRTIGERTDLVGVSLQSPDGDTSGRPLDELLAQATELAGDHQLVITEFAPTVAADNGDTDKDGDDDEDAETDLVSEVVSQSVAAFDRCAELSTVFFDPAISGPGAPNGLLTAERSAQPSVSAFLADPND